MTDNIKKMIDAVYAVFPFVSIDVKRCDAIDALLIKCRWYFRGECKVRQDIITHDAGEAMYEWTTCEIIRAIAMGSHV